MNIADIAITKNKNTKSIKSQTNNKMIIRNWDWLFCKKFRGDCFRYCFGRNHRYSLVGIFGGNLGGNLWGNLGGNLGENLGGNLWGNLGVNIGGNLGRNLGCKLWTEKRSYLKKIFWDSNPGQIDDYHQMRLFSLSIYIRNVSNTTMEIVLDTLRFL